MALDTVCSLGGLLGAWTLSGWAPSCLQVFYSKQEKARNTEVLVWEGWDIWASISVALCGSFMPSAPGTANQGVSGLPRLCSGLAGFLNHPLQPLSTGKPFCVTSQILPSKRNFLGFVTGSHPKKLATKFLVVAGKIGAAGLRRLLSWQRERPLVDSAQMPRSSQLLSLGLLWCPDPQNKRSARWQWVM